MELLRKIGIQEERIEQYMKEHAELFDKYDIAWEASAPGPGEKYCKETYPLNIKQCNGKMAITYFYPSDGFFREFMNDIVGIKYWKNNSLLTMPFWNLLTNHIGFTEHKASTIIKVLNQDNLFINKHNTIQEEVKLNTDNDTLFGTVEDIVYCTLFDNFTLSCYSLPPEALTFIEAIEDCPEDIIVHWDGENLTK